MHNRVIYILVLLTLLGGTSCRKTEFAEVNSPAYLRVFNSLEYVVTLDNKELPQPFLTMLIDPVFDEQGIPVSAAITGDFLDKRDGWARPYPDAANTNIYQKEYPGTAKVVAAPVLNGYDLSSWAQIPSGSHRVMFISRPLNTVPFYELNNDLKKQVIVDTTIDLTQGEVYTMNVIQKSYTAQNAGVYLRNETFVKRSFSDSLVYINFYNLSSEGFFANAPKGDGHELYNKLRDTMQVFCSLSRFRQSGMPNTPINGQQDIAMGILIRSQDPVVAPYYSFPLFADTTSDKIYTGRLSQQFTFIQPGYSAGNLGYIGNLPDNVYSTMGVGDFGYTNPSLPSVITGDTRSGLVVSVRSGIYNPRSFATINTLEYINRKFYVTTVQRKFAPPVY